jgi:hypothetical protein
VNHPKTLQQIVSVIAIAAFLMACQLLRSGLSKPDEGAQPAAPDGWKVSADSGGSCRVAAPPDWELGRDFFLGSHAPDPGPFEEQPGLYPPSSEVLWQDSPMPPGKYFLISASLVGNEQVCSVWRMRAEVDFTEAEKSELEQVGQTLQEVQP